MWSHLSQFERGQHLVMQHDNDLKYTNKFTSGRLIQILEWPIIKDLQTSAEPTRCGGTLGEPCISKEPQTPQRETDTVTQETTYFTHRYKRAHLGTRHINMSHMHKEFYWVAADQSVCITQHEAKIRQQNSLKSPKWLWTVGSSRLTSHMSTPGSVRLAHPWGEGAQLRRRSPGGKHAAHQNGIKQQPVRSLFCPLIRVRQQNVFNFFGQMCSHKTKHRREAVWCTSAFSLAISGSALTSAAR